MGSGTGGRVRHGKGGRKLRVLLPVLLAVGQAAAPAGGSPPSSAAERVPEALPGAAPFSAELRRSLERTLVGRGPGYEPRSRQLHADGRPLYTNRLLLEASPYLQQHAHNPVDWRPWGDDAFAKARELGRPVFLSIGYSTCHWCHVMEEEVFDDPEVARLLNRHFVAIKVDRELRPDVDAVYMTAANALGLQGGWPLNVFLTPEREPFYAGTYFPKQDRMGRIGFTRLLGLIEERWRDDPAELGALGRRVGEAVRASLERQRAESRELDAAAILDRAHGQLAREFDPVEGGPRGAPKFPASFPVTVLLRHHLRTGDPAALAMAEKTLEGIAKGGIRDHLGGGFHRYATDARWLVPHFEKMLYDNALLAVDYLEAAQLTGREDFAAVVRETLAYVAREMTTRDGAFTSATDADSLDPEGELVEGYFFSWTPEELVAVLGPGDAAVVAAWYGVTGEGPLEGRSVLHRRVPEAEVARAVGKPLPEVRRIVAAARPRLLAEREGRPAPLCDDKILAAWNGLMISAFARAGFVLAEPTYLESARRAASFVLGRMRTPEGALHRVHLAGRSGGAAFLEDYAFVVAGLLDLYEATGEPHWLAEAQALQAVQDRLFGSLGGYARTSQGSEPLLAREVTARDAAIPSGNSIAAMNLLRLAEWSGDPRSRAEATAQVVAFAADLEADPTGSARMLLALDRLAAGGREVALVGPPGADFAPMSQPLRDHFDPNRVLSLATSGRDFAAHVAAAPLLRGKTPRAGAVTAYVCQDQVCDRPTTDPAELAAQLREAR